MKFNVHSVQAPFLRYFRKRRMQQFLEIFRVGPATTILDVGGISETWSRLPVRPRVTLLNLSVVSVGGVGWPCVVADGRQLPFCDRAFDVVFSNSVIEHLSTIADQETFAREISRVGVRFYVQTPNRWFFVEPHLLTPLIHFLPRAWQRLLLRNFTVWGWLTRPTPQQCERFLQEVQLLDCARLQQLFPSAEIIRERFLGLTKSLIAIRPR